jgi:hypothetical protein
VTGKQLICMLLNSGMDLDKQLVFSRRDHVVERSPTDNPNIDRLKVEVNWDNHYAISPPVAWTHPTEGDEYYRVVLK